jgi:fatty acid desaturase
MGLLYCGTVLQWFSGNIGFHHIHHLSPRIPNYNLEKCHRAEPLFQTVKPVTLFASLKSLTFRLWDEQRRKLVSFRAVRNRPPAACRLAWRFLTKLAFAPDSVSRPGSRPRSGP